MGKIQEGLKAIIEDRKEMKGLTQKALARMMGAKPAMVSALLSGERRLNEDWIEKFCAALEITLGDLEAPTPRIPEPKVLREYSEKSSGSMRSPRCPHSATSAGPSMTGSRRWRPSGPRPI